MFQRSFSVALLFALAVALGCSGGKNSANLTVTGKVTIKGTPAKNVVVKLHDAKGGEFQGTTDAEGKFSIAAVPAGDMQVSISEPPQGGSNAPDPKAQAKMKEMKEKMEKEAKAKGYEMPGPVESSKVPPRYTDKKSSGLTWKVSPESLTKDFTLDG